MSNTSLDILHLPELMQMRPLLISGGVGPLDLHDPRILAMAAAQRYFLNAEYDEYAAKNASGAAFCLSAVLILMALLLLRHALSISNTDGDEDDVYTIFSGSQNLEVNSISEIYSGFFFFFLLSSFLLTALVASGRRIAVAMLHHGLGYQYFATQMTEKAALAATEVAFVLQSAHGRGQSP